MSALSGEADLVHCHDCAQWFGLRFGHLVAVTIHRSPASSAPVDTAMGGSDGASPVVGDLTDSDVSTVPS